MVKTKPKVAYFIGIHFEIMQDIDQLYKKPKDKPFYINKNSNYPPTIIKQMPNAISKPILEISSSKEM